ncbi:competence protein ComEC [Psychroflexus planctonicus]|uniref:Competence protein ComEC n=2 Tax=Psychroflexus planctonicus TaxID=1526575 RepID=A0ABQ1SHW9_9FLAO|nr:competence protein ComEC [Psychroflexus planctonicus]
MFSSSIQQPENQENHLIHFAKENSEQWISAEVVEILKSSNYYHKYIVNVHNIDSLATQGKVLVQIPKEAEENEFAVGDNLIFQTELRAFEDPKNPQDFNYKVFMENRLVMYQARPKVYAAQENKNASNLIAKAADLRDQIQIDLAKAGFNEQQLGLIQALLLGQKKQIDRETYTNFSKAGVVHILAVSGLHVGIVLLLLQWVFKPMDYIKNGRIFKTIIIVILLWGFALIAGFSPSVTRAVSMFSLFAIAINMKRKTNTINILCLSLFPILIVKPHFILEVGFQLSYAAVFSIVMLQPKLYKLYLPKTFLDKTIWSVFTVTLTAQLGVLPFSLFYFHQFPGLFIVANLVIIPFLGILLGGGILVILLALFHILPEFLVRSYSFLLDLLQGFVEWIATQEEFVYKDIFFNFNMFLCLILIIWCLLFFVRNKHYLSAVGFFIAFIGLTWAYSFAIEKQRSSAEIIIFNEMRKSVFGLKKGNEFTLYFSDSLQNPTELYSIKNYFPLYNIKDFSVEAPQPFYHFNQNETLLLIDSTAIYPRKVKNAYVYLSHSPKLNLERLIKDIQPKLIIADANNYASFVQKWEKTCRAFKIPFHSTYRDGAWRVVVKSY